MEENNNNDDITHYNVDQVFTHMVKTFKEKKHEMIEKKHEMIEIMTEFCINPKHEIYALKKRLEIEFSKHVQCQYCYLTETPDDYGCDLREIFYDRNGKLINNGENNGENLITIFNKITKEKEKKWHIMTDIDDTLYPNTEHGTYIAGSDTSWEQKKPYPGIKEFYRLFHENTNCSDYTTILSATPGCLKTSKLNDEKGLLHSILGEGYGFIQGVESKGEILSHTSDIISNCIGHLCGIKKTSDKNQLSPLFTLFGNTKFERFKQYSRLFPEYKIIFIGDNGQGDVLAGKQMVKENESCLVFIRRVCEDGKTFKIVPEENEKIKGLHFFNNYYELAKKFKELEIFSDDDINKIKESIRKEVEKTSFENLYVLEEDSPKTKKTKKTTKKTKKTKTKSRKNKK